MEIMEDPPLAVVSLSGQLIECNSSFAYICGFKEKLADTMNLSTLAKFSTPTEMLESLHLLSVMDKSKQWKVSLGQINPNLSHLEYEISVNVSDMAINGEMVLNATVKETQYSEQRSKSRAQSFSGYTTSTTSSFMGSFASSSFSDKSMLSAMSAFSNSASMDCYNSSEDFSSCRITHNVLIVEDSPMSLKMMARMVRNLGHEVRTAEDGVEALSMLKSHDFDIVIMDINMPKMNGLEASHEFRKMETMHRSEAFARGDYKYKPPLKLYAISGDISSTILCQVMNAGFDGFLPKPLREENFLEVLRTVEKK